MALWDLRVILMDDMIPQDLVLFGITACGLKARRLGVKSMCLLTLVEEQNPFEAHPIFFWNVSIEFKPSVENRIDSWLL